MSGGDKVRAELTGIEGQMQKASTALKVTGAAFTAVGAAGLKFASDARNVNATLGSTAITLGITTKELRNLLLATTNVTFPIKSVAATFDILTRAGVRNTEELQQSANAFDALADATGSSAEVVADQLIPVYRAFGLELPRTSKEMDKFTWLTKNTTIDLGEFTNTVSRLAPEMQTAGVSMDDAVISLAALNAKGIVGRKAIMELGEAVARASANNTSLATELGLTSDELVKYQSELTNSTGLTDKHGEALNKASGFMEKVRQKFDELTLVAGSFLGPLEPILAAMTALGPVMLFFSTSVGVATVKTIAHTGAIIGQTIALAATAIATGAVTAAQWLWNAAMTANPIGLLILGIVALVAAIVLIAKNWDAVREKTIEVWNTIVGFLQGVWDNIIGFFQANWDKILAILFPAVGIPILIARNWGLITDIVKNIWDTAIGFVKTAWDNLVSFIAPKVDWLIDKVNSVIRLINRVPGVNIGTIGAIETQPTLPGFQQGGLITEPTWLTRVGESSPYGIMAEKKPEFIVPQGSASVIVTGNTFNVRQSSDIDKIAEAIVSRIRLQQGVKI